MVLLRLWRAYQKCLAVHPVKTQVLSSGLIWGLGDVLAQTITRTTTSDRRKIDVSGGCCCCNFGGFLLMCCRNSKPYYVDSLFNFRIWIGNIGFDWIGLC
uniref:Uncharacterized protein n=1 Tax=Kalanchoe fedtschenkoi TaxID=63787 RepID=A0A7N0TAX7_KALFE